MISESVNSAMSFYPVLVSVLCFAAMVAGSWFVILRMNLKKKIEDQTDWINRSTMIAWERTRILEMIGASCEIGDVMLEICKAATNLLPGTICSYQKQRVVAAAPMEPASGESSDQDTIVLFDLDLAGEGGCEGGRIVIGAPTNHVPAKDSDQVYLLVTELAGVCVRNSRLYEGLVYHSTHDPLTELPNRRLYEVRLAETLEEAEAKNGQFAVIYIDVNRFKQVNDRFGYKAGDQYLRQISSRLRQQLRPVDILARVGGDEFIALLPFNEVFDRVYSVTARLKACFEDPFNLDGKVINGSASFGFARYPQDGLTAEELTRKADHAMYVCKHDAHISDEARGMMTVTPDELGLALVNGDFRLAYQPQFSAAGRLTGLEVLLRLEDPKLGLLPPSVFIPTAERHSIIVDIGAWALRVALQDALRWRLNIGDPVTVALNVSARQLQDPNYANSVLRTLKEAGFPPARLEIELIERSLVASGETVLQQLELLRSAGVRIALDDFGTEQSCLSLLHRLPIDTLKLDHSFIRAMDDDPRVLPIIRAIVSMAESLGKRVIAEAIEHVGPIPALLEMGRMDFQGYLLSMPLPACEVDALIHVWRSGIVMPEAFGARRVPSKSSRTSRIATMPGPILDYVDSSSLGYSAIANS